MPDSLIEVTYSGLTQAITRNEKLNYAFNHPDINKMVQGMAGIWQSNYSSEGGMVGGWRELSEQTQRLRQSRGYPPAHPILVQSGDLYNAAVASLLSIHGPATIRGVDVMMKYLPRQLGAFLQISGAKVDNQFRQRNSDFSSPARPFWFVNADVENAAAKALHEWIVREANL